MLTARLQQARQGDSEAMTQLCEDFRGLIYKAANQRHMRALYDDAVATAYLSFIEAVHSYDPAAGVPFAGYAKHRVQFAVWNLFKKQRYRWQREVSSEAVTDDGGSAVAEPIEPRDCVATALGNIAIAHLIKLLNQLPVRQRQVMQALVLEEKGLTEIARQLNLSPQAVYSLKKTAGATLKKQGFYMWIGNK